GARPPPVVARSGHAHRRGEVFDTGDPLGAVGDVLARSTPHDRLLALAVLLLQQNRSARKSQQEPTFLATVSRNPAVSLCTPPGMCLGAGQGEATRSGLTSPAGIAPAWTNS